MSQRIEALSARLDLLNELNDMRPTAAACRKERDRQANFIRWANPSNPKFIDFYKKSTTKAPDGLYPASALYILKPGHSPKLADIQPSDFLSLASAASKKRKEAVATFEENDKALKIYTARITAIQAELASPPEILTAADLALNADELQALLRTEAPDTDARYDDSPSARLATAEATEANASAAAESLSF